MTLIKNISISKKNEVYFDKLMEKFPPGTKFSEALAIAVCDFLGTGTINYNILPQITDDIEAWKKAVMNMSQEELIEILRKHEQIGTLIDRSLNRLEQLA